MIDVTQYTKDGLREKLIAVRNGWIVALAEKIIPGNLDTILLDLAVAVLNNDAIWDAVWTRLTGETDVAGPEDDLIDKLVEIIKQ